MNELKGIRLMAISSDKSKVVAIIPNDIHQKLKEQAKKESRSLSNMTATIIIKYLESVED
jgi:predicted DNA-binding protein